MKVEGKIEGGEKVPGLVMSPPFGTILKGKEG
jgi:hypothetical protein